MAESNDDAFSPARERFAATDFLQPPPFTPPVVKTIAQDSAQSSESSLTSNSDVDLARLVSNALELPDGQTSKTPPAATSEDSESAELRLQPSPSAQVSDAAADRTALSSWKRLREAVRPTQQETTPARTAAVRFLPHHNRRDSFAKRSTVAHEEGSAKRRGSIIGDLLLGGVGKGHVTSSLAREKTSFQSHAPKDVIGDKPVPDEPNIPDDEMHDFTLYSRGISEFDDALGEEEDEEEWSEQDLLRFVGPNPTADDDESHDAFNYPMSAVTRGSATIHGKRQRQSLTKDLFRFRSGVHQKRESRRLERDLEKWLLSRRSRALPGASYEQASSHLEEATVPKPNVELAKEVGNELRHSRKPWPSGGGRKTFGRFRDRPERPGPKTQRKVSRGANTLAAHVVASTFRVQASLIPSALGSLFSASPLTMKSSDGMQTPFQSDASVAAMIEDLVIILRKWRPNTTLPLMAEILGELGRLFFDNRVKESDCLKALQVFMYIREQGLSTLSSQDDLTQILWCARLINAAHAAVRNRALELLEGSLLSRVLRQKTKPPLSIQPSASAERSALACPATPPVPTSMSTSSSAGMTSASREIDPAPQFFYCLIYALCRAVTTNTLAGQAFPELPKLRGASVPILSELSNHSPSPLIPTIPNFTSASSGQAQAFRGRVLVLLAVLREKANIDTRTAIPKCSPNVPHDIHAWNPRMPASDRHADDTEDRKQERQGLQNQPQPAQRPYQQRRRRHHSDTGVRASFNDGCRYTFTEALLKCLRSPNELLCHFALQLLEKGGWPNERNLQSSGDFPKLLRTLVVTAKSTLSQRLCFRPESALPIGMPSATPATSSPRVGAHVQTPIAVNDSVAVSVLRFCRAAIVAVKAVDWLPVANIAQTAITALAFRCSPFSSTPTSLTAVGDPYCFAIRKTIVVHGKEILRALWKKTGVEAEECIIDAVNEELATARWGLLIAIYGPVVFEIDGQLGSRVVAATLPAFFDKVRTLYSGGRHPLAAAERAGLAETLLKIRGTYSREFYQPLLACATSDDIPFIVEHLNLFWVLQEILGPVRLYMWDSDLLVVIVFAELCAEENYRRSRTYLGQLAITAELLCMIRDMPKTIPSKPLSSAARSQGVLPKRRGSKSVLDAEFPPATFEGARSFLLKFQQKLVNVLVAKEGTSQTSIPISLKIMLCRMFREIRNYCQISNSPAWLARALEWTFTLQPRIASEYRGKSVLAAYGKSPVAVVSRLVQVEDNDALADTGAEAEESKSEETIAYLGLREAYRLLRSKQVNMYGGPSTDAASASICLHQLQPPTGTEFGRVPSSLDDVDIVTGISPSASASSLAGRSASWGLSWASSNVSIGSGYTKRYMKNIVRGETNIPRSWESALAMAAQSNDGAHFASIEDMTSAERSNMVALLETRLDLLDETLQRTFDEAALTLLVSVYNHLDPEQLSRIAATLWDRCLASDDSEIFKAATFLFMYCGDKAPAVVKGLLNRDLQSTNAHTVAVSLRKIARVFAQRSHIAFSVLPGRRSARPPFRSSGGLLPFVGCELGSDFLSSDEPAWLVRMRSQGATKDVKRRIQELLTESLSALEPHRRANLEITLLPTMGVDQADTWDCRNKSKSVQVSTVACCSVLLVELLICGTGGLNDMVKETVEYIIREDPAVFLRVYFNDLVNVTGKQQRELLAYLRLLMQTRTRLPPEFSYLLFNYLTGLLRYLRDLRKAAVDGPEIMSNVLPVFAQLASSTNGLLIRDLKKSKLDNFFLSSGSFWFPEAGSTAMFPHTYVAVVPPPDDGVKGGEVQTQIAPSRQMKVLAIPTQILHMCLLRTSQLLFMVSYLKRYPQQDLDIKKAIKGYIIVPEDFSPGVGDDAGALPAQLVASHIPVPEDFSPGVGDDARAFPAQRVAPPGPLQSTCDVFGGFAGMWRSRCISRKQRDLRVLSALRDRAWMMLSRTLFPASGQTPNESSEIAKFVVAINDIVLQRSSDHGIMSQALQFYINISRRFRTFFVWHKGYTLFVPTLFRAYCHVAHLPAIRSAVEYAWAQFFFEHEEVFVLQFLGSIVPNVLETHSNSRRLGEEMVKSLFTLLSKLGSPVQEDDLGLWLLPVSSGPEGEPSASSSFPPAGSDAAPEKTALPSHQSGVVRKRSFGLQDTVKLFLTIFAYAPGSLRAYQFMRVFVLLVPLLYGSEQELIRRTVDDGVCALIDVIAGISKTSKQFASVYADDDQPNVVADGSQLRTSQPDILANGDVATDLQRFANEEGHQEAAKGDTVKMRFLTLVSLYVKYGGCLTEAQLDKLFAIASRVARDMASTSSWPGTRWFREYVIGTALALKNEKEATLAVSRAFKQLSGMLRQHARGFDFSQSLYGVTAAVLDSRNFLRCEETSVLLHERIIKSVLAFMKTETEEEQCGRTMYPALVKLVVAVMERSDRDVYQELDKLPKSPRVMMHLILPICFELKVNRNPAVSRVERAVNEFYWHCLLSHVLELCRLRPSRPAALRSARKANASTVFVSARTKLRDTLTPGPGSRRDTLLLVAGDRESLVAGEPEALTVYDPGDAASYLAAITAIKVILVRAERLITSWNIWPQLAHLVKQSICHFGNVLRNASMGTKALGTALSFILSAGKYKSHGKMQQTLQPADYATWSMLEIMAHYPIPLVAYMRGLIQEKLDEAGPITPTLAGAGGWGSSVVDFPDGSGPHGEGRKAEGLIGLALHQANSQLRGQSGQTVQQRDHFRHRRLQSSPSCALMAPTAGQGGGGGGGLLRNAQMLEVPHPQRGAGLGKRTLSHCRSSSSAQMDWPSRNAPGLTAVHSGISLAQAHGVVSTAALRRLNERIAAAFQSVQDVFGPDSVCSGDVPRWTLAQTLNHLREDRELLISYYSNVLKL